MASLLGQRKRKLEDIRRKYKKYSDISSQCVLPFMIGLFYCSRGNDWDILFYLFPFSPHLLLQRCSLYVSNFGTWKNVKIQKYVKIIYHKNIKIKTDCSARCSIINPLKSLFCLFCLFCLFFSVSGVTHLFTLLILFPGFLTLVVVTSRRQVSGLGLPCSLW